MSDFGGAAGWYEVTLASVGNGLYHSIKYKEEGLLNFFLPVEFHQSLIELHFKSKGMFRDFQQSWHYNSGAYAGEEGKDSLASPKNILDNALTPNESKKKEKKKGQNFGFSPTPIQKKYYSE